MNPEQLRYFRLKTAKTPECSDTADVLFSKFGPTVSVAAMIAGSPATFGIPVSRIVSSGTQEQMIRPYTRRIIAMM